MSHNDPVYDMIIKTWGKGKCSGPNDARHWAYYIFQDDDEKAYWITERIDGEHNCWWRHWTFMSLPCSRCGAYSPLRCDTSFSTNIDGESDGLSCAKEEVVDHRPDDALPDSIGRYKENGFVYYFFKETLSDSLCGQETFRLKEMPDEMEEKKAKATT